MTISEKRVEAAAEAMWRAEAAGFPSVLSQRTHEAWLDQDDTLRAEWFKLARTALSAALPIETAPKDGARVADLEHQIASGERAMNIINRAAPRIAEFEARTLAAESALASFEAKVADLERDLSDYAGVEEVNRSLVKRGDHYRAKAEASEAKVLALTNAVTEARLTLREINTWAEEKHTGFPDSIVEVYDAALAMIDAALEQAKQQGDK